MKYSNFKGFCNYFASPILQPKFYKTLCLAFSLLIMHGFAIGQCEVVVDDACTDEVIAGTSIDVLSINCDSQDVFDVQAGGLYELTLDADKTYLFSLVANNSTNQSGIIKLFEDELQTSLLGLSSDVTANTTLIPSTITYANSTSTTLFLTVFTHDCSVSWAGYTLTVTCSDTPSCVINAADTETIPANETGCVSAASSFAVPTVTGPCDDTSVSIISSDGTNATITGDVVSLDADLSFGTYSIVFGVTDCFGNLQTKTTEVIVAPTAGCNSPNITLGSQCETPISLSMLLTNVCADEDQYTIFIDGKESSSVSKAGAYEYSVNYTPDDNTSIELCGGTLTAEDKSGPVCTLSDAEYNFVCGIYGTTVSPTYTDCSGVANITATVDSTIIGDCGEVDGITDGDSDLYDDLVSGLLLVDGVAIPVPTEASAFTTIVSPNTESPFVLDNVIKKVYTSTDSLGTSGSSCVQYIYIWRPSIIVAPVSALLECGTDTSVTALVLLDPQYVPHFLNPNFDAVGSEFSVSVDLDANFTANRIDADGDSEFISILDHDVCRFITTYEDIAFTQDCGSTFKVIRRWQVYDCCSDEMIYTEDQTVETNDTTIPEITNCPATTDLGGTTNPISLALGNDCTTQFSLDSISILTKDSCGVVSNFTIEYFSVDDDFISNEVSLGSDELISFDQVGSYVAKVTAVDDCGNVSDTCSYYLLVADETTPVIISSHVIVSLDNNGNADLCAASLASVTDNCSTVISTTIRNVADSTSVFTDCISISCDDAIIDSDGLAQVMVEFQAVDESGNTNLLMCPITIELSLSPTITCPSDTLLTCIDDYAVDSLYGDYLLAGTCSNDIYTVGYTDSDLITAVGDCTGSGVVMRTYEVFLNAVALDPPVTCTQTITITDNIAPTFDSVAPLAETISCTADFIAPTFTASDNCDANIVVVADSVITDVCLAGYTLTRSWTATDDCGNANVYSQVVTVTNDDAEIISFTDTLDCALFDDFEFTEATQPTISSPCSYDTNVTFALVSNSETSTDLDSITGMRTMTATYTASDACGALGDFVSTIVFEDCCTQLEGINFASLCFSGGTDGQIIFVLDPDGPFTADDLIFTATNTADATDVHLSTDNTDSSNIVFDRADPDAILTFDITVTAVDPLVVLCVSNLGEATCGATGGRIIGSVFNEEFVALEDVEVELMDTEIPMSMTDVEGSFTFEGLADQAYTLAAHKELDPLNGISTFDLVLMSQHVLDISTLDSPYKLLAADINMDEKIDVSDLLELRQLILYAIDDFTINTSWRFVNADYIFPDTQNPWLETIPETYRMESLSFDTEVNFVAIKIGDLDCTADTKLSAPDVALRETQTLVMNTVAKSVKAGDSFDILLSASQELSLSAIQFTLNFDQDMASLDGVSSEALSVKAGHVSQKFADRGLIPFAWYTHDQVEFNSASNITLTFTAKQDLSVADLIEINSSMTEAKAYTPEGIEYDVSLQIQTALEQDAKNGLMVYQNQPNPFQSETLIGYHLESAEAVQLTVFDIDGKLIYTTQLSADAGYNSLILTKADIQKTGVLFYQIDAAEYTMTKKMIILE